MRRWRASSFVNRSDDLAVDDYICYRSLLIFRAQQSSQRANTNRALAIVNIAALQQRGSACLCKRSCRARISARIARASAPLRARQTRDIL